MRHSLSTDPISAALHTAGSAPDTRIQKKILSLQSLCGGQDCTVGILASTNREL